MYQRTKLNKKRLITILLISVSTLAALFIAIRLDILVLVLGIAIILVIGALFLSLLWRTPGLLLLVYVLLLPINSLALAVIFKFSESRTLISFLQPWKEILAAVILLLLVVGVLLRMKIPSRIHKLDLLIALFFLLNLVYLLVPFGPDITAKLYGLRAGIFFIVVYALGRMIPLGLRLQKWIVIALMVIGALGGLLAIFEKVVLPPTWPVALGYPAYLLEFFGQHAKGHYGLTWTFETASGLRRSSAFFANPLDLATSTLITGVAALYTMFSYRPRTIGRLVSTICWLLIVVSLMLSVSRASIIAFGIQTIVAALWLGRTRFALLFIGIGVIGTLVVVIMVGPRLTNFIVETVQFQNPSSQGHLAAWIEGLRAMLDHPMGLGLGTSGQIGARFAQSVGGENQYVITGVQLGIIGFVTYLILQLSAIGYSLRAYRMIGGRAQTLAFIAAAGKFGLLFPAFTSNIDNYLFVTFVTWWLVGFSVQQLMARSKAFKASVQSAILPDSI